MDDFESSCSCEVVKVEIVNQESFEKKMRNQLLLAIAGAAGTLLIQQGAEGLANFVKARKQKKIDEAKKPK